MNRQQWSVACSLLLAILGSMTVQAAEPDSNPSGVWVGNVRITAVSEPASDRPEVPRAVASAFTFPILVHVSPQGRATLLKEVVVLPATADGPARAVVDPTRLPADEATLDGARRYVAATMDFAGATLAMSGKFVNGAALGAKIVLQPTLPTHPFAHRYHPDHDNLDDKTRKPLARTDHTAEVPTIERELTLTVEKGDANRVRGRYVETLSGLHHGPIVVEGAFELTRHAQSEILGLPQ
ncbi:MAG: hypothetical protein K0U93_26610 [Gammaproteobacteria bacterium]|nr:hypothetical protein [Gammaproteobacteria bacterium]